MRRSCDVRAKEHGREGRQCCSPSGFIGPRPVPTASRSTSPHTWRAAAGVTPTVLRADAERWRCLGSASHRRIATVAPRLRFGRSSNDSSDAGVSGRACTGAVSGRN